MERTHKTAIKHSDFSRTIEIFWKIFHHDSGVNETAKEL